MQYMTVIDFLTRAARRGLILKFRTARLKLKMYSLSIRVIDMANNTDTDEIPDEVENFEAEWGFEETQQKQGPQETTVEGMGKAVVEFIDFGYIESYRKRNAVKASEGRGGAEQSASEDEANLTPRDMAEIFNERYHSPSFDLSAEDVRTMRPLAPSNMLEALMGDAVDVEANADGSVTVGRSDETGDEDDTEGN